jgi:GNAT superfamily N-acetyltransferase
MLAIIRFNREGGDLTELTAGFENEIKNSNPREHHLIVAEHDGKVIGYARSSYFRHPEETSSNICPEGWYLTGVIVLAKYRRKGVAYQLTKKRLEWIAERADTAYYFANAKNKVSFDLHAKFGFEEVTRDFSYPGVEFEGGEGVLYKVGLIHLEQV